MKTHVDHYTYTTNCIIRLVREWEQHKSLIIAYDFDNTVYDYHKQGLEFTRVFNALRAAADAGLHLVVFTSCTEERFPEIREYLTQNRLPFHAINETPDFIPFKGRKVYYNLLLDDRAGLGQSLKILEGLLAHIRSCKAMDGLTEIA